MPKGTGIAEFDMPGSTNYGAVYGNCAVFYDKLCYELSYIETVGTILLKGWISG